MRTRFSLILSLAALVMSASCQKQGSEPGSVSGAYIEFSAPLRTRATDAANQSYVFQVRDWYAGAYHINNTLSYDSEKASWGYGSEPAGAGYAWLNGRHTFFGWLGSDGSDAANWFGPGFACSGTTLTLPAKAMNNSLWQMDFLYSNVVSRAASDNDYSPIPLVFSHLFSQVAISFRVADEIRDESITLKRVYLNNSFRNSNSASVDFSTAGKAAVTYGSPAVDGYFATPVSFNISNYDYTSTPIDVLSQVQQSAASYYMVWPQELDPEERILTVEYTVEVGGTPQNRTVSMAFPKGTKWEAGHKYSYVIEYLSGILKINEEVLEWDYEETEKDVKSISVQAAWTGWDLATCSYDPNQSEFDVHFKLKDNGQLERIRGVFTISSPLNCAFRIKMTSNPSWYTILPNDGVDTSTGYGLIRSDGTGYAEPGQSIEFFIIANDRPGVGDGDMAAEISFSIMAEDPPFGIRSFDLDSELQRYGRYRIIIPAE